jgi:hypothetical protein
MFRRILPGGANSLVCLDHRIVKPSFGVVSVWRCTFTHGALHRFRDGRNRQATGLGTTARTPDSVRDEKDNTPRARGKGERT